jgi:hypothetical protein
MVSGKLIALGIAWIISSLVLGGVISALIGGFIVVIGFAKRDADEYGQFPYMLWPIILYIAVVAIFLVIAYYSSPLNAYGAHEIKLW